ncbi:DUF481 domain-containing protein [Glaciecola punicea]|nr:DUF481 domain-containing protein [Glaciecola punicea]
MPKLVTYILCIIMVFLPYAAMAADKASDFFRNLSQEKNLLEALYSKSREQAEQDNDLKPFTLAGEIGLLNTTGNTDTSIIKFAVESNHEMTSWSNRYESQFLQRTNVIRGVNDADRVQTGRIEISAQFDYKLVQPNSRLFAYMEYDDNEFNRLRDQATLVMGYSKVAFRHEKSEFRYSIGPGYSHLRQTRNNRTIEEMIVRGTLYYNINFGENARFRQTLSAELGQEISRAQAQSSLSAKLFKKLALKVSVDLFVNDNVASQDSILSTQTSISLVYQFF